MLPETAQCGSRMRRQGAGAPVVSVTKNYSLGDNQEEMRVRRSRAGQVMHNNRSMGAEVVQVGSTRAGMA